MILLAILIAALATPYISDCLPQVMPEDNPEKVMQDLKNGIVPPATVGTKCALMK